MDIGKTIKITEVPKPVPMPLFLPIAEPVKERELVPLRRSPNGK